VLCVRISRNLFQMHYSPSIDCGNAFAGTNTNTTLSSCNMACNGNKTQNCGAGDRLNVYWSGVLPPAPPSTVPKVGNWTSLGCYKYVPLVSFDKLLFSLCTSDDPAARTLPINMGASADRTIETCTSTCFKAGYVRVFFLSRCNICAYRRLSLTLEPRFVKQICSMTYVY
jgi:hypothetical protein